LGWALLTSAEAPAHDQRVDKRNLLSKMDNRQQSHAFFHFAQRILFPNKRSNQTSWLEGAGSLGETLAYLKYMYDFYDWLFTTASLTTGNRRISAVKIPVPHRRVSPSDH